MPPGVCVCATAWVVLVVPWEATCHLPVGSRSRGRGSLMPSPWVMLGLPHCGTQESQDTRVPVFCSSLICHVTQACNWTSLGISLLVFEMGAKCPPSLSRHCACVLPKYAHPESNKQQDLPSRSGPVGGCQGWGPCGPCDLGFGAGCRGGLG